MKLNAFILVIGIIIGLCLDSMLCNRPAPITTTTVKRDTVYVYNDRVHEIPGANILKVDSVPYPVYLTKHDTIRAVNNFFTSNTFTTQVCDSFIDGHITAVVSQNKIDTTWLSYKLRRPQIIFYNDTTLISNKIRNKWFIGGGPAGGLQKQTLFAGLSILTKKEVLFNFGFTPVEAFIDKKTMMVKAELYWEIHL